jgi:hypothetical protein
MTGFTSRPGGPVDRAEYIGTTTSFLRSTSKVDYAKAMINQKVLFPHRGTAILHGDRLVLTDWGGEGSDVSIYPGQIDRISNEFTQHYDRFIGGGVRKFGAPIIVHQTDGEQVYLLLNYRWFWERTDNVRWFAMLTEWHRVARNAPHGYR